MYEVVREAVKKILISWNLILYTFLCTKIKKIALGNFFSLDACSESGPMRYETKGRSTNITRYDEMISNV